MYEKKEIFKTSIKVKDDIFRLQNELKANKIKIQDLTLEQKDNLIKTYKSQINQKRKKLNKIKQEIELTIASKNN